MTAAAMTSPVDAGVAGAARRRRSRRAAPAIGIVRRAAVLAILVLAVLAAAEAAMPGAARAATNTISCPDLTLAALNVRSEAEVANADMNAGSCVKQATGTSPTHDSGFSLQAYTEGAASGGAPFWILPSAVIGGTGYRFNSTNPVQCTGAGCSTWARGDYAVCSPLTGACHFTASFDVNGYPASISGDVPSGAYKIENISVSYEPASLPPPPNVAPVFSGVPSNIGANTDPGKATAVVTFTPPTATDDVDGPVTPVLTAGLPSGSEFPVGVTTVTYAATDQASNSATASFTVTVTDAEKPVIAPISDIVVSAEEGKTSAAVTLSASVSDNVDPSGSFTPVFKVGGTVITSGHEFPLGTTTVTVDANADTAGNIPEQISFTVTVNDDESPAFDAFPADIELFVDYPDTEATASWTEPTAIDNDKGVSVTQTAGPKSGASFPLGKTKVTYEAEDAADNTVSRSFTVTITQRAAGSVSFIVNSKADRSYAFSAGQSALNVTVTTSGGSGNSGALLVRPGTHAFAFAVPADIGIASATCSSGGTIDAEAHTGIVTLTSGSAVTCTVTALDSVHDTVAALSAMSVVRSHLMLRSGPELDRRLDRLNGVSGGGEISGFGMSYANQSLPLSIRMGSDTASFALSFVDAQNATDADPVGETLAEAGLVTDPAAQSRLGKNFDIWLEGKYAAFDAAGGSGTFGVLHGGMDYLMSEDLLVGVGAQLDWIGMDGPDGTSHSDGLGFMVGPYVTANLSQGFYFDARAAWGYSYNQVSPFGTYTDDAWGERGLVTAGLGGQIDLDAIEIRPEARLSWYGEHIAGYTDSLDVEIPDVTVETGTLEFGPTFRMPLEVADGLELIPFAGVNGIWTFAQTNTATEVSGQPGLDEADLRASVDLGFDLQTLGGFSLSASGFYDGIGTADYQAFGGSVSIDRKF